MQQYPGYQYEKSSWRVTVKSLMSVGMVTFLAFLVLALFTLVYGTQIVAPEIVNVSYSLYIVVPLIISIVTIGGHLLLAYYYIIVIAIVASAAWFLIRGIGGFVKELTMKAESRRHSQIFDVCGLLFAVLFFNTAVVMLIALAGGDVNVPGQDLDLWEMLFVLANASVWEELVSRVLLVGVPLVFIDAIRKRHDRKAHAYFLGGGFTIGLAEVALLLVSSTVFGLAHFAGGWGAWKVVPTAVAGLAFGYLFLRHGLAAAIVLHFGFDYLQMPMTVFESFSIELLTGISILLWLLLGLVMFTYYASRVLEFVSRTKLLEPRPRLVSVPWTYGGYTPHPQWGGSRPIPGTPPGWSYLPPAPAAPIPAPPASGWAYVCPVCGYTEARWAAGKFQCLRCGHSS